MKYCSKCGNEIVDEAVVCPKCGCACAPNTYTEVKRDIHEGLKLAAKILMIISTIALGWCIIPLAWCIPMTVSYYRKVERKEPISLGFKICTLLFVSQIAGILMLCDNQ